MFGHTFGTLANKLISTTNKEENQIIFNNIKENKKKLYKEKLYEEDETRPFYDPVIQPSDQCNDLTDAINLILDFIETIQLDLVWKYKNQRIKKWASDFNLWKQSKLLSAYYQLLSDKLLSKKNFFCICIKYI